MYKHKNTIALKRLFKMSVSELENLFEAFKQSKNFLHYNKLKNNRLHNLKEYIKNNPQTINVILPNAKMLPIFYCFHLKYFVLATLITNQFSFDYNVHELQTKNNLFHKIFLLSKTNKPICYLNDLLHLISQSTLTKLLQEKNCDGKTPIDLFFSKNTWNITHISPKFYHKFFQKKLLQKVEWNTIESILKGSDIKKFNLIIQSETKKMPFDYEKASLFVNLISLNGKKQRYIKLFLYFHAYHFIHLSSKNKFYSNWIPNKLMNCLKIQIFQKWC